MDHAGDAEPTARHRDEPSSDAGKGPRAWVVLLVTAAVLGMLVGGAVVIDRFFLDDDEPSQAAPATTEDAVIDVEPIAVSATRLFTRTTDADIEVRVNASDDTQMFGGMPFADGAPEWCTADGTVSVTALTADSIAQTVVPRTKSAPPTAGVSLGVGGLVEEAPVVVVVAQVDDDVRRVRLRHATGANDSMDPIEGFVALAIAVPMPGNGANQIFDPFGGVAQSLTLEVLRADGETETFSRDELWRGPAMWNDPKCMEAQGMPMATMAPAEIELELPEPGREQPADAGAERALIEQSLADLLTRLWVKDTLFALVDDASGIDIIMKEVMKQYGPQIREMDPEIIDMVFFSPIEASFTYTSGLDPFGDGVTGTQPSYGRARLIDGVWHITRSTVCQELAKTGLGCTV